MSRRELLGLGVLLGLTGREDLTDLDDLVVEVDVLPFQSVDLAGPHAGEEPAGHVVPVVGPDGRPDLLDLVQRERLHVGPPSLEPLHPLERIGRAETFAGHGQALAQQAHGLVDRGRRQFRAAASGQFGQLGAEGQYVGLGDGSHQTVPELRQQMGVEDRVHAQAVLPSPLGRHFLAPDHGEVREGGRVREGRVGRRGDSTRGDRNRDSSGPRRNRELGGLGTARECRAVVEHALLDLLGDPTHQRLDAAAVFGGVG